MGSGGSKRKRSDSKKQKQPQEEEETAVGEGASKQEPQEGPAQSQATGQESDSTAAEREEKERNGVTGHEANGESKQNGTPNGTVEDGASQENTGKDREADGGGGQVETEAAENATSASPTSDQPQKRSAGRDLKKAAANRISFYDMVDSADILPYLVIGNMASAKNEEFLKRKNIAFILNLTMEPIEEEGEERGRAYKQVGMEDDEDEELAGHFQSCFEFIEKAKAATDKKHTKAVLVHSYFGLSRTSAIVLGYLMKEKKWTLREAYAHLTQRHSSAKPNDGFVVQLLRFEQDLHGKMSMTLKDFYQQP